MASSKLIETNAEIGSLYRNLSALGERGRATADVLSRLLASLPQGLSHTVDAIPLLFNYDGHSLTLDDHFVMEPLFDLNKPRTVTLLCARQVGKTLSLAMQTIMESVWEPNMPTLFVAPFYEMIRRHSTDYFSRLRDESPVRALMMDKTCTDQVLERSFPNRSRILFTYAYRNADRARGIHARQLKCDEIQLFEPEVLPVLDATMLSSPFGQYRTYAGTPLTHSNIGSELFRNSTQSHWMIPCSKCRYENIAAAEYDLFKMIGPLRRDISRERPAIICAKCGHWLFPWEGRYVHFRPEMRHKHLGIHVPTIVLPHHCCSVVRWSDLHEALRDARIPEYQKYNEWLGIPWDSGLLLVTEAELNAASLSGNVNRLDEAIPRALTFNGRVAMGVDWGGGGISRESRTKVAVVALDSHGKCHVLFGFEIPLSMDRKAEAQLIAELARKFKISIFAHDTANIGDMSEQNVVECGVPLAIMHPMMYAAATGGTMIRLKKITPQNPRSVWLTDKSRTIAHLCDCIRYGHVKFFQMTDQYNARNLIMDFVQLRAEIASKVMGSDVMLIGKAEGQSDDFVHAVNFACLSLWQRYKAWPRISDSLSQMTPNEMSTWISQLQKSMDPDTLEALLLKPIGIDPEDGEKMDDADSLLLA